MENLWQKYGGSVHFVMVNTRETSAEFVNWLNGVDQVWEYEGTPYDVPGLSSTITYPALHGPSILSLYLTGLFNWPLIYIIGADGKVKSILGDGIVFTESELEGHVLDVVYQRSPVSLDLVVDVSSSMLSPAPGGPSTDSKLTLLQQAANIALDVIVDHGQSDDTVGLVRFTDNASEIQHGGNKLIAVNHVSHVRDAITDLPTQTGTCTAMGAGLQTAFDTLVAEATHDRFVILCTDGMQNIDPKVTKVGADFQIINSGGYLCGGHSGVAEHSGVNLTSYDARVHTVGIGATANYESLLQELADYTGGFYRGTNDPVADLDLIYTVGLCNCLAQGSPAVVGHVTGTLAAKQCQTIETFPINRTARKLTAVLSWQNGQVNSLTFWLRAPDGTLVKLDRQMKVCDNYCLATLYLPVQQFDEELPYVGEWTMVIRGETETELTDYHAMVVVEDRAIKTRFDYPRKMYAVGDILPLRMKLVESEQPIVRFKELTMEVAEPRVSLARLLAEHKVSRYQLAEAMYNEKDRTSVSAQIRAKLRMMESEPRYAERIVPRLKRLSLSDNSLECKISKGEIIAPIALSRPGLHSFKVTVECETPESGPIRRTDFVSVHVDAGHASPENTKVNVIDFDGKKWNGASLYLTPMTEGRHLLGPGLGDEIEVISRKKPLEIRVVDHLDGTYQLEVPISQKPRTRKTPVTVMVRGKPVWKGNL
jgi:hypothetical protein